MIQAVIFDCFGVLIGDGLEIAIAKLEKTDSGLRAYVQDTIYQANRGILKPKEARRLIAERLGLNSEEWFEQIKHGEARNPDVLMWVQALRKNYKTALLSNVPKGALKERFTDDELGNWFDVVVVSGEVGLVKPDPEIYRLTAERLGVAPEACVFIDDRENYAEGARAVGMQAIWFQSYSQAKKALETILSSDSKN
jgi:HAD superfamily hydrolase (TIGR01509 family)